MKRLSSQRRIGNCIDMNVAVKAKPISKDFPDVYELEIRSYDCQNTGITAGIHFSSLCKEDVLRLSEMLKEIADKMFVICI